MKQAMRFNSALLVLILLVLLGGPVLAGTQTSPYPKMAPLAQYLSASQTAEIALARSAAPKSIADDATILTLGRDGYKTAVKGNNGFVCYVARSWLQDFDAPQFWDSHIRTPQCWNAAAVSSMLPDYLKRTQWVLAGISKDEMLARTKAELVAHEVGSPAPMSMAYMMSKEQYINDPTPSTEARWYPHVMFFVPATGDVKGSIWGDNLPGAPIFSTTSDVEPITTFFVVVPRWSDGTFGPYIPKSGKAVEKHHH